MGIEMFKSFAKGYDKEVKENKDVWIYTSVSVLFPVDTSIICTPNFFNKTLCNIIKYNQSIF